MFHKRIILPLSILIVCSHIVLGQVLPETKKTRHYSPTMAMIFSTCVPGLGQVYNKKYWKLPIVCAAMGTTIYLAQYNNKYYKHFKESYIAKTDKDPNTIDPYPKLKADYVVTLEKDFHRYRDLNIILTALVYTLNIADAYVDAQLKTFDISNNLSLNIHPAFNLDYAQRKPVPGLSFALTFR